MKPALKSTGPSQAIQQTSVRNLKSFGHAAVPSAASSESGFPRRTLSFGQDDIISAASEPVHGPSVQEAPVSAVSQRHMMAADPALEHRQSDASIGHDAAAFHADMGFADQPSSSVSSFTSSKPSSAQAPSKPSTATHVPLPSPPPQHPMESPMSQGSSLRGSISVRGQKQMPISMATSGGAPKHATPHAKKQKGKKDDEETTLTWITYPKEDPEGKNDYCGEMKGGKRHGVGMLNWQDGASYAGQFEVGKPSGCGYERYADGSVYLGQYKRDCRHGLGRLAMADGKTYSGQWEDGMQHGVGIELMTIHGVSREIVAVYKRGQRVESYVKTEKNSARLTDDLEKVFAVAGTVIKNVQEVTQKVRNTTVGTQQDWEKDIEEEVERRVGDEIERIKTADRERQIREERERFEQQHQALAEPQPEAHRFVKPHPDDSVIDTVKHRDISTSHGRVPPTSPWAAAEDQVLGTEEDLAMMSMEKSRIANEINLVKTLIEQMENDMQARRRGDGGDDDDDDDDDEDDPYYPGGEGAGNSGDRRLMTPLKDVNIRAPSLAFNPFSHVPGLERFSRGPPRQTRKRNAPQGQKGLAPIKGVQPGDNSGYKGEIVAGMPFGHGSYRDPRTGDEYEGEWAQGLFHGKGKLVKANGIVYQGDFVSGERHGFGVLQWPSNPAAFPRYEGAFEHDRKHGAGVEGEDRVVVHYVRGCKRKGLDNDVLDPRSKPITVPEQAMVDKARSLRERRKDLGNSHPNIIKDLKQGRRVDWDGKKQGAPEGKGKGGDRNIRWGDEHAGGDGRRDSMDRPGAAHRRHSTQEEDEEEQGREEGDKEGEEELEWDEFFTRGGAARKGEREGTEYGRPEEDVGPESTGEVKVIRMAGDDGSEFIGESLNGKPHGLGTIMYDRDLPDPEGRVEYAGTFRGGQRHGVGSMLWRDGTNYMGEWKRNRPNGFGFEAYPDGSYYQGTFDNDQRDGVGVYEFANGLYYSGGWRQGRRYGSGIATDVNKTKYVLTYDRTGKLLTKHQFSSKASATSADDAEREVVAEVLRVTLEVRKAAEKARGVAAIELRRRADIGEAAFNHHAKQAPPPVGGGAHAGAFHDENQWRYQGPQASLSAADLLGTRTGGRIGQNVLKPGHGANG